MSTTHRYYVTVCWLSDVSGDRSTSVPAQSAHEISAGLDKKTIQGSSGLTLCGDRGTWKPEELLVAAVSTCHEVWYLHLCANAGITVVQYVDRAEGFIHVESDGSRRVELIVLRPQVTLGYGSNIACAEKLHVDADLMGFVAKSFGFPVNHEPETTVVRRDGPEGQKKQYIS
jgi:organic hydroperoxide reductase OsmC/OhrA